MGISLPETTPRSLENDREITSIKHLGTGCNQGKVGFAANKPRICVGAIPELQGLPQYVLYCTRFNSETTSHKMQLSIQETNIQVSNETLQLKQAVGGCGRRQ